MKTCLKQILFGLVLTLLTGLFFTQTNTANATGNVTFKDGYYTNISGYNADVNGNISGTYIGDGECSPSLGYCKANKNGVLVPGWNVQKYVCKGKFTNCDGNHNSGSLVSGPTYSTAQYIYDTAYPAQYNNCGYTIQLDVNSGSDGFMTWYSGDCTSPTTTPTPTSTPTVTPTPTGVPTATPTPTVTVTPTPTVQVTPTPTTAPVVTPTPGSDTTVQCPTSDGGTVNITVSNSSAANFNCNSVIVNVTNTSNSTSSATGGNVVVASTPAISDVKELPKTGLPIEAWGLSGMLPIGFGLKKFIGAKNISKVANSATYIWQQREFLKR